MKHTLRSLALLSLVSSSYADDGFTKLFDGETLKGWTNSAGQPVEEGGWVAEDGILHRTGKSGDLYSAKEYGDFEFRWDWKISEKGNSGVKYRVTKYGKQNLGLEYQVLDNEHPDGKKTPKRQAGALYDLLQNSVEDSGRPVGEWNASRIVARGNHLQHFLNGNLIVDITVGSDEWKAAHAASKFKSHPDFATNPTGRIYLQDHGDEVWYRNLEIKELDTGWTSLFNGKNLDGWSVKSGKAKYHIDGDAIVGTTEDGSPNSFLTTDKQYSNFELEFDVKVHDRLNSGVMIRSLLKDVDKDAYGGRIFGPQVEIEASGAKGAESGYIYGEATGRGWLTPKAKLIPHKVMKDGEWNHFRIIANGSNIKTWINGQAISDLSDEEIFKTHPTGHIGLQVHGIGKNAGPFTAAWKNIKIKELK
ncbi:DUF1080 domain-containing protein [Verrucomicrobiaceae bacterium 227]